MFMHLECGFGTYFAMQNPEPNNMNELKSTTDATWIQQTQARAANLNTNGAHYLVGWLTSAGFQKPEVMAELEWIFDDIETDPQTECMRPRVRGTCEAECAGTGVIPVIGLEEHASPPAVAALHLMEAPLPAAPKPGRFAYFLGVLRETFVRKPSIAA